MTELAFRQELLQVNIRSQEEERVRISTELHDNVGSSLSTLRFLIRQIKDAGDDMNKAHDLAAKYGRMIDSVIDDVRNISHSLAPPGLAIWGLHEALEALGEKVSGTTDLQITITCHNEQVKKLRYEPALAIYRVIQELLTNTLKHAFAQAVTITISGDEKTVQITYTDDGIGADMTTTTIKGIGLRNIENRILMVAGNYAIDTAPGKGFKFTIEIPIATEHDN